MYCLAAGESFEDCEKRDEESKAAWQVRVRIASLISIFHVPVSSPTRDRVRVQSPGFWGCIMSLPATESALGSRLSLCAYFEPTG